MKSITIRDVPADVHRELAARAARHGLSLQEYVLGELARLTARPSAADLMEQVRSRKAATGTTVSPDQLLAWRDADRA